MKYYREIIAGDNASLKVRMIVDEANRKMLTQKRIAERSGLTQSTVLHVISGQQKPSASTFIKLAKSVGLIGYCPHCGELIDKEGEKYKNENQENN